jgi:hypothetical protein
MIFITLGHIQSVAELGLRKERAKSYEAAWGRNCQIFRQNVAGGLVQRFDALAFTLRKDGLQGSSGA